MKKAIKVILVVGLCLLIAGGAIFAIGMSKIGWDFNKLSSVDVTTESMAIENDFNTISVNASVADVQILQSEDDKVTVDYYIVKDKKGETVTPSIINDDYINGVYKNFKKFLDKSYETLKIKNTWVTSAIYLGIFFGLSVIMGFLMWLLTRGKNNPNNYYTPWLTMKIQARLGLAPALITLAVGFFLTSYAPMIFIMTVGLRVMWVSMKELRPIQQ